MEFEKNMRISSLFEFYGGLLSERQREIVRLYIMDDLSLSEVAELTGITRQGVRDALLKSEEILQSAEDSLGLIRQHAEKKKIIGEAMDALQKIRETGTDTSVLEEQLHRLLEL